jgi:hypothetical protein
VFLEVLSASSWRSCKCTRSILGTRKKRSVSERLSFT